MPRRPDDNATRRVAQLLDAGLYPKKIAQVLKWNLEKVRWHIRKLKADRAFFPIAKSGQWRRGPSAEKWIGKGSRTGPHDFTQPSPADSTQPSVPIKRLWGAPDFVLLQGARFKVRVLGCETNLEPTYHFGHCPVHQTSLTTEDGVEVKVQAYGNPPKTLQIFLMDLELHPSLIPKADEITDTVARQAIRTLAKRFHAHLARDPVPIPAQNAGGGSPLRTGELVFPTPGLKLPRRVRLTTTAEYNRSKPPGPAIETGDKEEAITFDRVLDLPARFEVLEAEVHRLKNDEGGA